MFYKFAFGGAYFPIAASFQEQVLAQKSVREFSLKTPVPPAGKISHSLIVN